MNNAEAWIELVRGVVFWASGYLIGRLACRRMYAQTIAKLKQDVVKLERAVPTTAADTLASPEELAAIDQGLASIAAMAANFDRGLVSEATVRQELARVENFVRAPDAPPPRGPLFFTVAELAAGETAARVARDVIAGDPIRVSMSCSVPEEMELVTSVLGRDEIGERDDMPPPRRRRRRRRKTEPQPDVALRRLDFPDAQP